MKLRIGSRGSKLAVTQAEWVGGLIHRANPDVDVTFVRIVTTGDRVSAPPLQSLGGKGVFVKEIEEALFRNEIDLAVHSLKDVPQMLPPGLKLGAYPKREDPRDVVISRFGEQLRELPKGSTVGTSSPRRVAQIRRAYWKRGYRIEPIRGNVDTRIGKVKNGDYDAIILAAAGLKRLGLEGEITEYLSIDDMMPAPCQGCLGLELREDRDDVARVLESVKDRDSDVTARAERAFLQGLGGDCTVPVAAHASVVGDKLIMKAVLLDASGDNAVLSSEDGDASEPEFIGARLAGRVLQEGGSEILLAGIRPPE